jgi:hypothetical protein
MIEVRMRLAVSLIAACMAASAAAEAQSTRVQPEGIPAAPGQYTDYQDWLSKQTFTKTGMPDDVVNEYVHCAYQALYEKTTPTERDVLDGAARGNGMTTIALRAFERAVADRFDDGEITAHIVKTCKAPYERFLEAKRAIPG